MLVAKWGKNVIIPIVDYNLSKHTDNRRKYVLVLGEGQTDGFGDIGLNSEAKYMVNIILSQKNKIYFSLHYNTDLSFQTKRLRSEAVPNMLQK